MIGWRAPAGSPCSVATCPPGAQHAAVCPCAGPRLRDEAPLYWDPVQKLWVISRYDDVLEVERAAGRYCSSEGSRPLVDQREDMSMINMDDPGHQEQRRLVSGWFTPRAMRDRESHVRGIVTAILHAVATLGQCEAIDAIASRLPAIVISDLLG